MTFAIILFDMPKIRRVPHSRHIPIHILQPPVQSRIIMPDTPHHQLKMLLINSIKAYKRGIQFDVYFRDLGAEEVERVAIVEHVLEAVEGCEDDGTVLVVIFLRGGETSFVDAFVKVGHHPFIYFVDLLFKFGRVEVQFLLRAVWPEVVVEGGVEHSHYIFAFVIYNLIGLLIPENGYTVFAFIVGLGFKVYLVQKCGVEEAINGCAGVLVVGLWKTPSATFFWVRLYNIHGQIFLQPFHLARDNHAMGKWAKQPYVEMIPVELDWELRGTE